MMKMLNDKNEELDFSSYIPHKQRRRLLQSTQGSTAGHFGVCTASHQDPCHISDNRSGQDAVLVLCSSVLPTHYQLQCIYYYRAILSINITLCESCEVSMNVNSNTMCLATVLLT